MLVFHGKMTNQPSYSGTCHRPSRPSCVEGLSNRSPRPWKRVNYGESSMPCRGRMTQGKKENENRIRINQRKELETVATLIAMIRQDGSRGQKRRRRRESLAQLHVGNQTASFPADSSVWANRYAVAHPGLLRNRCRTESRYQTRSKSEAEHCPNPRQKQTSGDSPGKWPVPTYEVDIPTLPTTGCGPARDDVIVTLSAVDCGEKRILSHA